MFDAFDEMFEVEMVEEKRMSGMRLRVTACVNSRLFGDESLKQSIEHAHARSRDDRSPHLFV